MKFPVIITHRHTTAKIYGKSERYPYYRLTYRAGGKRIIKSFVKFGAARQHAEQTLRQIAAGNDGATALSAREVHALKFAQSKLAALRDALNSRTADVSTPPGSLSLEDAIAEFTEAKQALGSTRLIEALKGYLSTVAQVRRVKVSDAAETFLCEREAKTKPAQDGSRAPLSAKFVALDRNRLDRFRQAFVMDVCDLGPEHLDLFFREHLGGLSAKSRNHFRGTLRLWIKWCVRHDFLPRTHRLLESDGLCPNGKSGETTDGGPVASYTPAELQSLLTHADEALQPTIAIGAFAGLRTAELLRLDWGDVWRRPGYVEVPAIKAKTRSRRLVPIGPALNAWLEPARTRRDGRVWPHGENKFHADFREAARTAGIRRADNALRHGFISSRLALVHNEHQVASEAGTSPAMIHQHYRELVTPEEAKAWFNVLPSGTASNVITLQNSEAP